MDWKSKKLESMGDIMDAVKLIAESGNRTEAKMFFEIYCKTIEPSAAINNLRFGSSYCAEEPMTSKIINVFDLGSAITTF